MEDFLELELYKEVTAHYEKYYKLQPLTAKVYSFFIFNNCQDGLTFDFLVDTFQVSKSSMSHSINTLIELNFIEDFKNENERKRHFRINKKLFLMRLLDVEERLISEKNVYLKLKDYKMTNSNQMFKPETFDLYIEHLAEVTTSIENTIQNLNIYISKNEN